MNAPAPGAPGGGGAHGAGGAGGAGAAGGAGRRIPPEPSPSQRAALARRLSLPTGGGDRGEVLPLTREALALPGQDTPDQGAARLEALVHALGGERVVVPVEVEAAPADGAGTGGGVAVEVGPRPPDVHADGTGVPGRVLVDVAGVGPALAVYSSAAALAADRAGARPMPLAARQVALAALVEAAGHVVVDPGPGAGVVLPRPAVAALAQGDSWLPAWRDPELLAQLRALAAVGTDGVLDVRVSHGGDVTVRVDIVADPSVDSRRARAAVARAARAVAGSPRLSAAADRVVVVPVWAAPA